MQVSKHLKEADAEIRRLNKALDEALVMMARLVVALKRK